MNPKVAVVEDNPDNRMLVQALLDDRYEISEYETGMEAVAGLTGNVPVIELLGYLSCAVTIVAGRADWYFVGAFLAVAVVLGGALSLAAVALEELSFRRYPRLLDLLQLFGLAALENFGYRQMNTWWRVKGTVSALRGVEGWGKMTRKGFG